MNNISIFQIVIYMINFDLSPLGRNVWVLNLVLYYLIVNTKWRIKLV